MSETSFEQEIHKKNKGFTLVEIMIVIVIIIMLTQIGNIGGLFRAKERNKIEEIAIKIVATLDEEKLHALLGKTENKKIVRKRLVEISPTKGKDRIVMTSESNLADTEETTYDATTKKTQSWNLKDMEITTRACPDTGPLTDIIDLQIEFIGEDILFKSTNTTAVPDHVVLLLTYQNVSHEVHMDRRTGLTYEIVGKGKDTNGNWSITCN